MNSKVTKEMRRIAETIPEEMLRNLTTRELAYPSIVETINKAIEDPETNEKMRERLTNLRDSGRLNVTEEVVDKEAEKVLDQWWSEEISKAIDEGLSLIHI